MGDDGVARKILETIAPKIKEEGIEILYVETDAEFAYSQINEDDYFIFIDATCSGGTIGTVTNIPLDKLLKNIQKTHGQHQISIFTLLKESKYNIQGIFIGIEVEKIDFGFELSENLQGEFSRICKEVENIIKHSKENGYE